MSETRRELDLLRRRTPEQIGQIAKSRGIGRNSWVISGTRIHVDSINRLHDDGFTVEEILAEYPDLTAADVLAAVRHRKAAA